MVATATVVGAGIAGLAAAAGLARLGWDVTVIERAAAPRQDGAGLMLWPNAMRALEAIGIGDAVRDIGAPVSRAVVRRCDGKKLTEIPVAALTVRHGPMIAVRRSELHRVLGEEFPGDLRYSAAATAADGQVLVGGERPQTTLVVGADGIDSVVRTALAGVVRPRSTGQFAARGLACTGAAAPTVTSESWGRGLRFGLVPLRAGLTYWFAVTSAREAAERPHSVFAGWHSPIADVLTAPQTGSTPVLPLEDLPPLRSWHDGRSTVLIGDAAHAMTPNLGQGAAQALEDVAVLLAELEARPVPDALAAYEHRRKRRAELIVARSRSTGRIAQAANPATAFLRDTMASATFDRLTLRQAAAILQSSA
jgi:2-polyprenyl-6-methoxyphenol hydroxylase-like FAD-dependent oxidoreductase